MRTLSAGYQAAIAAEVVGRPVQFVRLDLDAGATRVCDAPFDVAFDSDGDSVAETFIGAGEVGRISEIVENAEGGVDKVTLSLSAVKTANISIALSSGYRWRFCRIWRGFLGEDNQISVAPRLRWVGRISHMLVHLDNAQFATIEVVVVSRRARWERPLDVRLMDHADHQSRYPGDTFFARMPELVAGKEIVWGKII